MTAVLRQLSNLTRSASRRFDEFATTHGPDNRAKPEHRRNWMHRFVCHQDQPEYSAFSYVCQWCIQISRLARIENRGLKRRTIEFPPSIPTFQGSAIPLRFDYFIWTAQEIRPGKRVDRALPRPHQYPRDRPGQPTRGPIAPLAGRGIPRCLCDGLEVPPATAFVQTNWFGSTNPVPLSKSQRRTSGSRHEWPGKGPCPDCT